MNLTLSVDEQIVERARTTAAAMGMSLNQAVRNYLGELAGQSSPEADIAEIEHLSLVCARRPSRLELRPRATARACVASSTPKSSRIPMTPASRTSRLRR